MSTHLDHYLLQLSVALEREQITPDQVTTRLRDPKVRPELDSENVKVLIRGAFIASMIPQIGGNRSGYCMALVAYLVAKEAQSKDLNFGLAIGVGNVVVCSLYAVVVLLSRMEQSEEAANYLKAMLPLLEADCDTRGYLEALITLANGELESEHYERAAEFFQRSIGTLDGMPNPQAILGQPSNLDMVCMDNRNTFDFGNPQWIDLLDDQLIRLLLHEHAAQSWLGANNSQRAVEHAAQAVSIWRSNKLQPGYDPALPLQLLHTYGTALAGAAEYTEATVVARELMAIAKNSRQDTFLMATAFLLAFCYQELGEHSLKEEYKAIAETTAKKLQQKNR